MAHLGLSQRLPFRNSFMPSRRQSLQTGSMVRAMNLPYSSFLLRRAEGVSPDGSRQGAYAPRSPVLLHTAFLGWPAAVVRQRRDIFDGLDVQAGRLQGRDRRLAARSRTLDAHFDLFESELGCAFGCNLSGALGGKRRAFTAALEADCARRSVAQRIAIGVSDGDDGVVERRLDVRHAPADVAALLAFLALGHGCDTPEFRRAGRVNAPVN